MTLPPQVWIVAGQRCVRTALCLVLLFGTVACARVNRHSRRPATPVDDEPAPVVEATAQQVADVCGACHATPPPDSFPRSAWRAEVRQGLNFFHHPTNNNPSSLRGLTPPTLDQITAYYEHRAPEVLRLLPNETATTPMPASFHRRFVPLPPHESFQAVSNVNLVHLTDPAKLDLLTCDMSQGKVLRMKPYEHRPHWQTLAQLSHPAHTEVVDLDHDGVKDIVVADLGSFFPTDDLCGRVVWLHGKPDGSYTPVTLLENVGRVADVRAGDFSGNGKTDLIVAVFGWRHTGSIILLENQTTDWNHPRFVPRVLDDRSGAIHVPVCDLDGDGKLDFVALISQEYETVVAFLGDGKGHFTKKTLYTGPHPAYGSTGIQLVDVDGDGKLDVLYTNGDVFDESLLKPYHGVHWLRNTGTYPFEDHLLTSMYGVHRAVAADFRGTGRKDIVAVSLLPPRVFPMRKDLNLDAVVYLEQVAPGKFVRHSLEKVSCDHVTCAAGAWNGDGKVHFVTGNFCLFEQDGVPSGVTLWENLKK